MHVVCIASPTANVLSREVAMSEVTSLVWFIRVASRHGRLVGLHVARLSCRGCYIDFGLIFNLTFRFNFSLDFSRVFLFELFFQQFRKHKNNKMEERTRNWKTEILVDIDKWSLLSPGVRCPPANV